MLNPPRLGSQDMENASFVNQEGQPSSPSFLRQRQKSNLNYKYIFLVGLLTIIALALLAVLYKYDKSLTEREKEVAILVSLSYQKDEEIIEKEKSLDFKKIEVEKKIDESKKYIAQIAIQNEQLLKYKTEVIKIQNNISLLENKEIQTKKKEIEKLTAQLKEQAGKLSNSLKDLSEKDKEIEKLKDTEKKYVTDISQIKKDLEGKDKEIAKLTSQLKQLSQKGAKELDQKNKEILRLKEVERSLLDINSKNQKNHEEKDKEIARLTDIEKKFLASTDAKNCANLQQAAENLKVKEKELANVTTLSKEQAAKIAKLDKEMIQKVEQIASMRNSSISCLTRIAELKEETKRKYISVDDVDRYLDSPSLKIKQRVDYLTLKNQIEGLLGAKQETFSIDKSLEKIELLKLGKPEDISKFQKDLGIGQEDYERLAINLTQASLTDKPDPRIFEVEYVKADAKHSFSKVKEEVPICVVVEDDAGVAEDNARVLESMQRQNYSNFHVVWVQEGEGAKEGQKWPEGRMRNRLKVVKNQQRQGTTANLYFWGSKFCGKDDIVVPLGKGAGLLGRQSLKILNAAYQSPDVMFTRSPVLLKRIEYDLVSSQLQQPEEELSKVDRKYSKKQGLIRSFRRKLLDSVPIESLMKIKYINKTNVSSLFFESDANTFALYSHLGQASNGKGADIKEYLQISYRIQYNCEKAHESYVNARLNYKGEGEEQHPNWSAILDTEIALSKCLTKYKEKISHHLDNPVRVVYGDKIWKRTIYNEKALNKTFAKDPKYLIDLKEFLPKVTNDWRSLFTKEVRSEKDEYYVLTPKDYQAIIRSKRVDFEAIKLGIENEIPFEVLEFEPDPKIDMNPPLLTMQKFKTDAEGDDYIFNQLKNINTGTTAKNDFLYQIAYRMQMYPEEREIIQAELYYLHRRYNITKQTPASQLPICIISAQYKVINRKNGTGDGYLYQTYFKHLQMLNYTNYHVVYIDDASPDNSAQLIYEYVKNSKMKAKNRMKIVHTLRNVGVTVNLMYWPQKMCRPDDIVVYIDADDNILGRQSLRVFNHLYHNPNTWYLFTRHIKNVKGDNWHIRGYSYKERNIYVRITDEWGVSNTRTFRSNLMRAVPFSQIVEYHYSKDNYTAWPVFQDLSADGIQVSAHVELAGNPRIAYYEGFTYAYSGNSGTGCYERVQKYDWRKVMTRSRLKVLDRLDGTVKGELTEGEPFQTKYYQDAIDLSKYLLDKKCFI